MAFSYRELFFGGTKFCCCVPVRIGVIIMSILGILFSGALSIALWYEVSVGRGALAAGTMAAFVVGGLVETFLCAASTFGLVGALVRKQSFVQIYATITYVHLLLNFGVAIWLLVEVSRTANTDLKTLCTVPKTPDTADQCRKIFSLGQVVYYVVAILVLLIELYGALIVTRYVNQLKREKSNARQSRRGIEEAFKLKARYSALTSYHELESTRHSEMYDEYDPYREYAAARPTPPEQPPRRYQTFIAEGRPSPPVEVGYGGGTWSHEEISNEEKARLQREERELGIDVDEPPMDEVEAARRRAEMKVVGGPTTPPYASEIEELPRYTYSAGERPRP